MAHELATVDTFAEKLAQLRKTAHKYPVFVVWTAGEKDDKTPPVTWCPDCNRCVPAVREAAKDKGAYLLEVSVGSSEAELYDLCGALVEHGPAAVYKAEDFFLRTAPEYVGHFTGIPLLAVYANGELKDTTKTELEKAPSHDAALAVADAFITKTGVAVGVALLAAGVAFAYSQRRASK